MTISQNQATSKPNTSFNDVTGDSLKTKASSQAYRDNWDNIFGNKNVHAAQQGNILEELPSGMIGDEE